MERVGEGAVLLLFVSAFVFCTLYSIHKSKVAGKLRFLSWCSVFETLW
jgi:hypothetical protein